MRSFVRNVTPSLCLTVLLVLCFMSPMSAALATVYHAPYSNYAVSVDSGTISSVGYNGGRTDFTDSSNALSVSGNGVSASLQRQYVLTLIPDPGWQFTSLNIFASGGGYVTQGTFRAGPLTYAYNGTSGNLLSGSAVYYQNDVWYMSSDIPYAARDLVVPASTFSLTYTTNAYVGTYGGGGEASINLQGFSLSPTMELAPVPEPTTLLAAGALILPMAGMIRRKSKYRNG